LHRTKTHLSTDIITKIKDMILSGELSPGQQIVQEEFAKRMGVSRTPLLHALQVLKSEMLVTSIPNRGIFVRKVSLEELKEIFEFREAIETMACKLAAERVTPKDIEKLRNLFKPFSDHPKVINPRNFLLVDQQFHEQIINLSGNKMMSRMTLLGNVLLTSYQKGLLRTPTQTLPEHMAIIDALEERNGHKAAEYMSKHLSTSVKRIIQSINTNE